MQTSIWKPQSPKQKAGSGFYKIARKAKNPFSKAALGILPHYSILLWRLNSAIFLLELNRAENSCKLTDSQDICEEIRTQKT